MARYFVKEFTFELPFDEARAHASNFGGLYTPESDRVIDDDRVVRMETADSVVAHYCFNDTTGLLLRADKDGLAFLTVTQDRCTRAALPDRVVAQIEAHIRDRPLAFQHDTKARTAYGSDIIVVLAAVEREANDRRSSTGYGAS